MRLNKILYISFICIALASCQSKDHHPIRSDQKTEKLLVITSTISALTDNGAIFNTTDISSCLQDMDMLNTAYPDVNDIVMKFSRTTSNLTCQFTEDEQWLPVTLPGKPQKYAHINGQYYVLRVTLKDVEVGQLKKLIAKNKK